MTNTDYYQNFIGNTDRIQKFLKFSSSLDLNAAEIKELRDDFYSQKEEEIIETTRATIIQDEPSLENNTAELIRRVLENKEELTRNYVTEQLDLYHQLRNELAVVQIVTSCEIYITDAIRLLLKAHKDFILSDNSEDQQMKYSQILRYTSLDELVDTMIENRTQQIMKKSILNMLKFLQTSCKGPNISDQEKAEIKKIWDTRNLIVHQGGVVDRYFSTEHGLSEGSQITITQSIVDDALNIVKLVFERIDLQIFSMISSPSASTS